MWASDSWSVPGRTPSGRRRLAQSPGAWSGTAPHPTSPGRPRPRRSPSSAPSACQSVEQLGRRAAGQHRRGAPRRGRRSPPARAGSRDRPGRTRRRPRAPACMATIAAGGLRDQQRGAIARLHPGGAAAGAASRRLSADELGVGQALVAEHDRGRARARVRPKPRRTRAAARLTPGSRRCASNAAAGVLQLLPIGRDVEHEGLEAGRDVASELRSRRSRSRRPGRGRRSGPA